MTSKHTWKPSQSTNIAYRIRADIINKFKIDLLCQSLYAARGERISITYTCDYLSRMLRDNGVDWKLSSSEVEEIKHVFYAAGFQHVNDPDVFRN